MINYPVPTESRWAMWSISQAKIIKHNRPWPRADGAEITSLDADLVPLLEVRELSPVDGVDYDSATHRIERSEPTVDVPNNTHTHSWEIIARSQEDLDARAKREQDSMDAGVEREQAKALYQDMKNGIGTQLERLRRVEKVCAYNLKMMQNL